MRISKKQFLCGNIALIAGVFLVLFVTNTYVAALLGVFIFLFTWYVAEAQDNTYIILFLVAFFTFLLGRPIVKELFHNDSAYYSVEIPPATENYTYIVMTVSLLSIAIGYAIAKLSYADSDSIQDIGSVNVNTGIKKVERVTYYLTVITALSSILINAEKAIYVQKAGYLSSYLGFASVFPGFVSQIADMLPMVLAFYLATLPSKVDIKVPICLYLIAVGLNLFAGRRYEVVSAVLLLVLYASYRNKLDDEKWITGKQIALMILLLPAAMSILILMESWRAGGSGSDIGINLIGDFLNSVGGSSQIISYEEMFHDELASRNVLFSFGNVWRSLNGNALAQMLGISTSYSSQTVENALYGHSLSSAIMYKINPSRMLAGGGIGSCYIAELMCDFSYVGVIAGNMLIGFLLRRLNQLRQNHLIANFLTIFLATSLFRLPRDSFDYFFYTIIGIKSLLFFALIYVVYHQKTNSTIIKAEEASEVTAQ